MASAAGLGTSDTAATGETGGAEDEDDEEEEEEEEGGGSWKNWTTTRA